MIKFLALRLAGLIGLLLLLTVVLFILQGLTPGDPAQASLGQNASEAAIAAERARLGLDQPLPVQYLNYLRGLVTGDLGESFRTHRPVSTDLADALPATAELLAWADRKSVV